MRGTIIKVVTLPVLYECKFLLNLQPVRRTHIEIKVFWDVTPCGLMERYKEFASSLFRLEWPCFFYSEDGSLSFTS
jgi:hypothetical protein